MEVPGQEEFGPGSDRRRATCNSPPVTTTTYTDPTFNKPHWIVYDHRVLAEEPKTTNTQTDGTAPTYLHSYTICALNKLTHANDLFLNILTIVLNLFFYIHYYFIL